MTASKSGARLFAEWYGRIGELHRECIHLKPSAAFQGMGNFGDEPTYPDFKYAWDRRFGFQLETPKNIEDRGWYLMFFAHALFLLHRMREGAEAAKFASHVELANSLLERLHSCYGTPGFGGVTVTDSTWALLQFEKRGDCEYLTVRNACLPYFKGPLQIGKSRNYAGGGFYIADATDRFHFTLNSPWTVEFQRASLIFFDFPNGPLELKPADFPIIMAWIFAGGFQNVINYAEDALSHRQGATYSEARRMLRAALGIGLPPPSDRF